MNDWEHPNRRRQRAAKKDRVIEEKILERVRFADVQGISNEVLNSMSIDKLVDWSVDQSLYRLTAEIYSNPAGRIEYSFPTSPWQFWKARHFPKWLLKRFPVRKDFRVFSAAALFPEATIPHRPANLGRPIFYLEPELD